MKSLRAAAAAVIALGVMAAMATPAHAWNWSNCGQWATWSSNPWTVYNDDWNPSGGWQCLYVNNQSNWQLQSNFTGGGVKSYGNVSFSPNTSIYGYGIWAYFNASTPGGSNYDCSFDCWTNDGSEIMIWENWNGVSPAGSVKYANVGNIGNGGTWNAWQGNVGHNCVSFTRQGQWWSGTEYVTNVIRWAHDHGLISGTTITQVQFGFEVSSTSGTQYFTLNSYNAGWK